MLSGLAAPVTVAPLSVSAMANGASKNSACVRGGIYKGRVGREGSHPFPRAPCSSWGIYKGAGRGEGAPSHPLGPLFVRPGFVAHVLCLRRILRRGHFSTACLGRRATGDG